MDTMLLCKVTVILLSTGRDILLVEMHYGHPKQSTKTVKTPSSWTKAMEMLSFITMVWHQQVTRYGAL